MSECETSLILVPGVELPVTEDRATQVLQYASRIFQITGRSKLALAACLHEIKEEEYWKNVAESFKSYVYTEFGYTESTVSALISVYTTMVENLAVDPESIKDIPWAKLAMLVPSITVENKDELLSVARDSTQNELKKYLKDLNGLHVTESKTSTGNKFTFTVNDDQAEVIKQAIDKATTMYEGRTDLPPGMIYETIFAEFLLADCEDPTEEHLVKSIAYLEKLHNVTISYEKNGE